MDSEKATYTDSIGPQTTLYKRLALEDSLARHAQWIEFHQRMAAYHEKVSQDIRKELEWLMGIHP